MLVEPPPYLVRSKQEGGPHQFRSAASNGCAQRGVGADVPNPLRIHLAQAHLTCDAGARHVATTYI